MTQEKYFQTQDMNRKGKGMRLLKTLTMPWHHSRRMEWSFGPHQISGVTAIGSVQGETK